MDYWEIASISLAGLVLAAIVMVSAQLHIGAATVRFLRDAPLPESEDLPLVSIVVAARNEERDIEAGLESLVALDYPNLEVIVVNDRSTDRTGEIIDRFAATHRRLRAVHLTELPSGWLGKNHAMHRGAEAARGDFILFTDADVILEPNALRRAVKMASDDRLDQLTATPECRMPSLLLEAFVVTFAMLFTIYMRPWAVRDPNSTAFVGIGAFNLIRASTYRARGGHEPICMRPDDDLMLGKLIKKGGGRCEVLAGSGCIHVPWYASLGELIVGLEKNTFAGVEYSLPMVIFSSLAMTLFNVWPFVAIWFVPGIAGWLYIAAVAILLFNWIAVAIASNLRAWLAPLFPVTILLFVFISLRSMILTYYQGGIRWRDTFYSLDELRANRI